MTFLRYAILVALVAGTGCARLEKRIQNGLQDAGSEFAGVPVEVRDVRLRLLRGSGEIRGLTIGNPEGYTADHAFVMDRLLLDLGVWATLFGKPLVLDELVIVAPVVQLEFNPEGGSNLEDLAAGIRERSASTSPDPTLAQAAEPEPQTAKTEDEPLRIKVDRLAIREVTLNVRGSDGAGSGGSLPPVVLHQVGGKEGATAAELGGTVVLAIVNNALRQAVGYRLADGDLFGPDRMLSFLNEQLALTDAQRAELAPVVDETCRSLNEAVRIWVEHGYVDLASLEEDFAPILEAARAQLDQILDPEQAQAWETFAADLDEGGLNLVLGALVGRLGEVLGLTPQQLHRAAPVLHRHLAQVGELMARLMEEPGRTLDDLQAGYAAIQAETRQALIDVLGPEEVEALEAHQEALREELEHKLFSGS